MKKIPWNDATALALQKKEENLKKVYASGAITSYRQTSMLDLINSGCSTMAELRKVADEHLIPYVDVIISDMKRAGRIIAEDGRLYLTMNVERDAEGNWYDVNRKEADGA